MSTPIAPRCALVLETNNLRGGDAAHNAVLESLQRAVAALAAQTVPLTALAQLIVTHDGLSETACAALSGIAGRPVTFVRIAPTTGYYDAKNSGFAATDPALCDYVIFADADCLPAADWLAELLLPFSTQPQLAAVAGRTSYAATLVGTALTTLDFMYFPSPLQPQATRNFYANNVVFRREIFAAHAYQPLDGVYRAHCQVLGLHLQACGIAVHYAPRAHTVHKLPDTRDEALQLRWWRGQDTLGLTPHLVKAYLPASLHWLARSGPVGPLCVLASRLWFSARALNTQDLTPVRGLRRGAALALIAAFSAVDMLGSLAAGLGWRRRRADAQALSYHHS